MGEIPTDGSITEVCAFGKNNPDVFPSRNIRCLEEFTSRLLVIANIINERFVVRHSNEASTTETCKSVNVEVSESDLVLVFIQNFCHFVTTVVGTVADTVSALSVAADTVSVVVDSDVDISVVGTVADTVSALSVAADTVSVVVDSDIDISVVGTVADTVSALSVAVDTVSVVVDSDVNISVVGTVYVATQCKINIHRE